MKLSQNSCRSARKGVTISEMCVVLALVAVVALAVVSFTTMVSAHSKASVVKLNAMEDVELTRSVLEGWLGQMEKEAVTVGTDGKTLTAVVNGETYTASFKSGKLGLRYLTGERTQIALKAVTKLRFEIMKNAGGTIYFFTVVYEVPHPTYGDVEQTVTFSIDPWLGETVG